MDFGVCLPNYGKGAGTAGIEAAAAAAEELGWASVWATDHVIVGLSSAERQGRVYEALTTLGFLSGRHDRVQIGTSVLVPAQRNGVLLAKELATLDDLSGGRLTVGTGVGWNRDQFVNLGARFTERGAILDETIGLWRHLWSGSKQPFDGAFYSLSDYVFEPLPARGALPIWVGGSSTAAIRRAATLGDGWHPTVMSPTRFREAVPRLRAAAAAAGRPMPTLSVRARVAFDNLPDAGYSLSGGPEQMASDIRSFEDAGVTHVVLAFDAHEPTTIRKQMERFNTEVLTHL